MGIIDVFTRFSDAQDLAGITDDTVVSDKAYKLSASTSFLRDVGAGNPLTVRFYVDTAITGATSMAFNVILASADTLASNVLTLASTGAVAIADLTAGASFDVVIPAVPYTLGNGALRQYLGVSYTVVGTTSAGTATASIVTDTVAPMRRTLVTGYTGP
jgi:hypothetical protein